MKLFVGTLLLVLALPGLAGAAEPGTRNGEVRQAAGDTFVAWDASTEQWLEPEAFWASFARNHRGRQRPGGREYPPYDQVEEHDTFLVQVEDGPCLMYFFHKRWRRANDVRRWDEAFNEYGGCPSVFD